MGVDALVGERDEHVGEPEDRVAPEAHAAADGERVVARTGRLEAEQRRDGTPVASERDRTARSGIVARQIERARWGKGVEGLAAEESDRERRPLGIREVDPGTEPALALIDVADVEIDAAV